MITAYLTHPECHRHHMGPEHPESPMRLEAIHARLMRAGLLQQTMQGDAPAATDEQLTRVHPPHHLQSLQACVPEHGMVLLEDDTLMNAHSLQAARHAAGAVVSGVDRVYRHQADNVFCAVRPPGHHAERDLAMGFCFFNNVAVGAAHARQRYGAQRVAILDFDVHQCNGTIDIFRDDPEVLVCTSFQSPFYPWRHLSTDAPNIINTPLPAGTDGPTWRRAIERDWLSALDDFAPQIVLISAGFDAHRDDPLAECCLDDADYYWITRLALGVAARHAEHRLVSVLEGGYDLPALGRGVEAHLKALMGLPLD